MRERKRQGRERLGGQRPWRVTMYGPSQGARGRYTIDYKDPASGSWTSRSGGTNRREADSVFGDVEQMLDASEVHGPSLDRAAIDDLAARYLEQAVKDRDNGHLAESTFANYERIIRLHIVPVLGTVLVKSWSVDESQQVIDTARAGGYRDLAALRKVLSLLMVEAQCRPVMLGSGVNPLKGLKTYAKGGFQGAATVYVPPSARAETDTVRRLAVALWRLEKRRGKGEWWLRTMLRVAALCGLRWGELIGLRPCDYDVDSRTLTVSTAIKEVAGKPLFRGGTKNTKTRFVQVPASLARELERRCRQVGPTDLLFPGPSGGPWRRTTWFRGVYRPAAVMLDWTEPGKVPGTRSPRLHWHAFRHHCATWWHEEVGLTWPQVSSRLGHSSVAFTQAVYVRQGEEADQHVRSLLDHF